MKHFVIGFLALVVTACVSADDLAEGAGERLAEEVGASEDSLPVRVGLLVIVAELATDYVIYSKPTRAGAVQRLVLKVHRRIESIVSSKEVHWVHTDRYISARSFVLDIASEAEKLLPKLVIPGFTLRKALKLSDRLAKGGVMARDIEVMWDGVQAGTLTEGEMLSAMLRRVDWNLDRLKPLVEIF